MKASIVGVLVLAALARCGDQLIDVPTTRPLAAVVAMPKAGHCPSDTVLLTDDDQASGAGTVPTNFDGVRVLRCEVDHSTVTIRAGVERFTVRQWETRFTPQIEAAFTLPDREFRDGGDPCAASTGGTAAIYVVDGANRAVRVLPPTQEPCHDIRDEVKALLPDATSPAKRTFEATRAAR